MRKRAIEGGREEEGEEEGEDFPLVRALASEGFPQMRGIRRPFVVVHLASLTVLSGCVKQTHTHTHVLRQSQSGIHTFLNNLHSAA